MHHFSKNISFNDLIFDELQGLNYPFGFDNKEKENELYGEGNGYDFGARMYDPRLGRWFSVDKLYNKFPFESHYCFVSNSPTIAIDPDGQEKIIVIGGENTVGKEDRFMFINCGLKQLRMYLNKIRDNKNGNNNEPVTLLITNTHVRLMTRIVLKIVVSSISSGYKSKVNIEYINDNSELDNYLNYKDKISTINYFGFSERKNDLITDISFFGHGIGPGLHGVDEDTQGNMGTFNPDYPSEGGFMWGKSDIDILKPEAFSRDALFDYSGMCNGATNGTTGWNLAQYTSLRLQVTSKGWDGTCDYSYIYGCKDNTDAITNPFENGIGEAKIFPKADIKYKTINTPSQIHKYKNGIEIKN